jgi:hypothetical protein
MARTIQRLCDPETVQLKNSSATTPTIDFGTHADIGLAFPSGWTACNLTFYTEDAGGTWVQITDDDGVALSIATLASRARGIPAEVYPFQKLRIVTDNAANNAINVRVYPKA